jgi:hypothetical protein
MSEDRNADARDYAHGIAAELAEVETGIVDGERYADAWEAVYAWAETCVLDVEYTLSLAGGGASSVEITRTIGGPGCWIACNGDGTVTVRAAWGGGEWRRTVDAPTIDAYAWELVGELARTDHTAARY